MKPLNRLWAIRDLEMPANPKTVLLHLALYANKQLMCWPSQSILAIKTGLSVSTVKRSIAFLSRHGLILQQYRKGQSSTIKLAVDDWLEMATTKVTVTYPPRSHRPTEVVHKKTKRKTKLTSPTCSIPKCNSLPLNGEQGKCLHHFRQDNPRSHNHAH